MIEQALFKHLPELTDQLGVEHIKPLLDRITIHGVSAGTVLVQDQAPIDSFHLVLSGRLSLAVEAGGHSIVLGELLPGNWCGELAYFSGIRKASSTVTALEETDVARLTFADFEALMAEDSIAVCRLTHAFIRMMMHRLEAAANNPIIDPHGQMLIMGELSMPWSDLGQNRHGVVDFVKTLLGVR
ncbi:MAG TPA: cyclic nucleotide-binding domain-containing protein [Thiobacillaceae bacterium]|nr:cyclic nucleotide-binding domain-containing protein [Thiobacillaceae bacterium]HNF88762.1 cyclic nucleotide-binding domain-containing protein [Thiobacillaceae bacterium]HNH88992.1 cyclic nucleotide-binding domain-containing protein [Thiobacillaceae bacterium]HNI07279.1 cyclic nucleotide-binding domain-containing protein [Thiobacillaceae bacterium]